MCDRPASKALPRGKFPSELTAMADGTPQTLSAPADSVPLWPAAGHSPCKYVAAPRRSDESACSERRVRPEGVLSPRSAPTTA